MTNAFVSYSRRDTEFARKIVNALKEKKLDSWVDWEGIPPTVDWMEQIKKGIAEADTFLFLLSPDSASSKVCGEEIEYAAKNGKRVIPIVVRDVKPDDAPLQTRHLNWIFFRETDNFDSAFDKLLSAIKTDYGWLQAHRRLQVKALEWEKNNKENGFLLRGLDLQDAEAQHAKNSSKEPLPTDLQREYVFTSRKVVDRQRRILTITSVIVAIALLGLGIFASIKAVDATNQARIAKENETEAIAQRAEAEKQKAEAEKQRNEAERQANIAHAGQLAAQSVALRSENFQLSMLLAIEANAIVDNSETQSALLDNAQAHPQLVKYVNGVSDSIYTLAYSLDGKVFASGSADGDIVLWDAVTNQPIGKSFNGNTNTITSMDFSPDGKILATGSFDSSVILWDTANQQMIVQLVDKNSIYGNPTYVAFSPDGKTLATGQWGEENSVRLWNVETKESIGAPLPISTNIGEIEFSPNGDILAISEGNDVHIFNANTGQSVTILRGNVYSIARIAFSADGKYLVAGSYDHMIVLWDAISMREINRWSTGNSDTIKDSITDIAFSVDGNVIASANNNGDIFLWDKNTYQLIGLPLTGVSSSEVLSIAFNPDGNTLTSANRDGSILVWNLEERLSNAKRLLGHTETFVTSVAFSPVENIVASGGYDNKIIFWDAVTSELIGEPLLLKSVVRDLAYSPDGTILASTSCATSEGPFSGCDKAEILLWDVTSRKLIGTPLIGHQDYAISLSFNPDGKTLLSSSVDGTSILWDVDSGEVIGEPLIGSYFVFSPDGKLLATLSEDKKSIVFVDILKRVNTGNPLIAPEGAQLSAIAFNPDGKKIAATYDTSYIVIWDLDNEKIITQIFAGLDNAAGKIIFSPDGSLIASQNLTAPILFNAQSGEPIGHSLTGHSSYVNDFSFSPDGKLLASVANDRSLILWNLDIQAWINNACERAGHNLSKSQWAYYFPNEEYRLTCSQWPEED